MARLLNQLAVGDTVTIQETGGGGTVCNWSKKLQGGRFE